jgi:hypothetical protein
LADWEREWVGWGRKPDPEKARRAFFVYNEAELGNKTAYKLPFAEVIDEKLMTVPRGIFAVAQVIEGARGGVDLPKAVSDQVRRKVTSYYQMNETPPWDAKPG